MKRNQPDNTLQGSATNACGIQPRSQTSDGQGISGIDSGASGQGGSIHGQMAPGGSSHYSSTEAQSEKGREEITKYRNHLAKLLGNFKSF